MSNRLTTAWCSRSLNRSPTDAGLRRGGPSASAPLTSLPNERADTPICRPKRIKPAHGRCFT